MLRCCIVLLCAMGPASAADITLVAAPGKGAEVVVAMHLDHAPSFATAGAVVRFDNTRLRLTTQAAGSFATFIRDTRPLSAINASGEVRFGTYALVDDATGNGTLGVFTFTTLAAGPAAVTSATQAGAEPFGCVLLTHAGGTTIPDLVGLPITVSDQANQAVTAEDDPGGGGSHCGLGTAIGVFLLLFGCAGLRLLPSRLREVDKGEGAGVDMPTVMYL